MAWRRARGSLVAEVHGDGLALGLYRNARRLQHSVEETGDILAATDGGAHALQLRRDGLRASAYAGRSANGWPFRGRGHFPTRREWPASWLDVLDEVQAIICCGSDLAFAPEQRALEQRLSDLLAGAGHRDRDAEIALDALMLADEDIEDRRRRWGCPSP